MKKTVLQKSYLFPVLILLMFLQIPFQQSYAQQKLITEIHGTVKDKNKQPLEGAFLKIKGTSLYAITNKKGQFKIRNNGKVIKCPFVLEVRYLGMKSLTIPCKKQHINIVMSDDEALALKEVVSTGYRRIDKRMLTSSVTSVKADEILTPGLSTIDVALEGRIPDLVLQNNSGSVGATSRIRVRGTSTLLGSREPLWVVDGFIVTDPVNIKPEQLNDPDFVNLVGNAIAGVNPQDIEQIDVLKDASATALYGTRAANGVIVITTKQGTEGPVSITYNHISKLRLK